MTTNKNLPYYLVAVVVFLVLKFSYTLADNNDLLFLLKPTNKGVELSLGSKAIYTNADGFRHVKANIIIDKSCSGFNFWILCFIMFAFTSIRFLKGRNSKIISLPVLLLSSLLLTIFVNISRILVSISAQSLTNSFFHQKYVWLHQATGAFVYFSFLVLFYFGLNHFYSKIGGRDAKFTQA